MDKDSFPSFIIDYLNYANTIQGRSKNTIDQYSYDILMFLSYISIKKKVIEKTRDLTLDFFNEISQIDIIEYSIYLHSERKQSPSTRNRRLSSLRSLFKFLHLKMKLIKKNPLADVDSAKTYKRLPIYLSLSESEKLLETVELKGNIRDYTIITLFLNCGLRLSELTSLNTEDVFRNFEVSEYIKITGKGNKQRIAYLNEACLIALNEYLPHRLSQKTKEKALFLTKYKKRIGNRSVQYLIKKYIEISGIDPSSLYSTHKLRHTAATLMYQYGDVDIRTLQGILGHSSIKTTEIYTHTSNKKLKEDMEKNPLSTITKE
jgi:integrase/recombinase XerD